jgi:hypothetical protein
VVLRIRKMLPYARNAAHLLTQLLIGDIKDIDMRIMYALEAKATYGG